jgi:hypothetical protein
MHVAAVAAVVCAHCSWHRQCYECAQCKRVERAANSKSANLWLGHAARYVCISRYNYMMREIHSRHDAVPRGIAVSVISARYKSSMPY